MNEYGRDSSYLSVEAVTRYQEMKSNKTARMARFMREHHTDVKKRRAAEAEYYPPIEVGFGHVTIGDASGLDYDA